MVLFGSTEGTVLLVEASGRTEGSEGGPFGELV